MQLAQGQSQKMDQISMKLNTCKAKVGIGTGTHTIVTAHFLHLGKATCFQRRCDNRMRPIVRSVF